MTATASFVCDWCGATPDEPVVILRESGPPPIPSGWWPVPGKGPNGAVGHCCPECFTTGAAGEVADARTTAAAAAIETLEGRHAEISGARVEPVVPAAAGGAPGPRSPWTRGTSPFSEDAGA